MEMSVSKPELWAFELYARIFSSLKLNKVLTNNHNDTDL